MWTVKKKDIASSTNEGTFNYRTMEEMRTIEQMLEQHEIFKEIWVWMWVETIFEWLKLKEEMERKAWELRSEYAENKIRLDKDKAIRYSEIKNIPEKITDKAVDSLIKKEYMEKEINQNALKTQSDLLLDTAKNIELYTNTIKLNIRTTTNI